METTPDAMRGKGCLITGATSGIGLVTARELARRGAHVVLVGRSQDKSTAAIEHIRAQTGNRDVESLLADLSSQEQIRNLAREFRARHSRLDLLVNNAGGIWMQRRLTADGLEMTFAVNHIAYFLLTHLLLDMLQDSAPGRIINVSSDAHRGATLDFDDLLGERRYGGGRAYCQSKLMNLLFTYELARRLKDKGVTVNSLHPGWVATGFGSNNGWRGRLLQFLARCFAINADKGARTVLYLATSPDVAGMTGRYFVREKAVASSPTSYVEDAARRLWQVSEQVTGLHSTVL